MQSIPQFVGIDVSKATLDVAVRPSGQSWHIDYDEPSVTHLIAQLQALKPKRIVVEATGGGWRPLWWPPSQPRPCRSS